MKVFPDGKLYIISGCPCDPDYEHTLYWPNKEGQHAYFLTKAKYRVDNMSYQRAKRGRVRVQYKVEDLYDCNYIAFQNSSFGNKWFYAFIDDVTYVNNITSEISYTIDVIQTWITEMDLQQCFVVREHSVTDVAGDNRVPENLDTGDMIMWSGYTNILESNFPQSDALQIVIAEGLSSQGLPWENAGMYGKMFSNVKYIPYDVTAEGIDNAVSWLNSAGFWQQGNPSVLSIFMCPKSVLIPQTDYDQSAVKDVTINSANVIDRSDGSPVRNQKMYTHPYTFLRMTNCNGQVKDYAYELFKYKDTNGKIHFDMAISYGNTVSLTFIPRGYNSRLSTNLTADVDNTITYNSFPTCAFAVSDMGMRLIQAGVSAAISGISTAMTGGGAAGIAGSALMAGAAGFATGSITDVGTVSETPWQAEEAILASGKKTTGKAGQARIAAAAQETGTQLQTLRQMANSTRPINASLINHMCGNDLFNAGYDGPRYAQMIPTQEYIDRIDDYFSRYGYATNKIKTPNISSRPHWNYVQTIGCKLNGSIPCSDEAAICAVFNKGVTFWKHPEEVGNFSLDNSPT